jgi:fermentation-respiration switch protein FrsA (DUF1100 family)
VDRACRPIREAAARGEDADTPDFLRAWTALTDSLAAQAEAAEKAGHIRTAGQLYARAAGYLCQAERMQSARAPDRLDTCRRVLRLQLKAFALKEPRLSRVEIPYEGTTLPAYFSQAPATEAWAAACVDYLTAREDVDPAAIGLVGWSLGGYYAPRAAAFEKRLALVVAWGANHDWGAVQRRRLEREGERPVPHYWDHVLWVWGHDSLDEFIEFADQVNLNGVAGQITVPFLIARGAGDRQIPLEYAHQSYDQAVASPKRELRVFTAEEGATEHICLDDLPHVSTFIADWVAGTFAELSLHRR